MHKLGRIQGDINISSIEAELEIDIEYTMYDKTGERCAVHVASQTQCTVAPESTTRKYSGAHWCNSGGRPTGMIITNACSS
jgi:hypothetical protein